jgi:uncharacterized membrane protein
MAIGNGGPRGRAGWRRPWRPRNRAVGCLLWIVALLVLLLLLSVLFGGFQKGSKVGGSAPGDRAHPAAQELALGGITALS